MEFLNELARDPKALWVDRACPLCSSQRSSSLFVESNFSAEALDGFAFASRKLPEYLHARLLNCTSCDLVYASPALEPQVLAGCYQEAAFDSGRESEFAARTYERLLRPLFSKLPEPLSALDVGCGDGAFLGQLLAAGFKTVEGVEPSAAPVECAKPDIRRSIHCGLFMPENYAASSFSLITCFQVMEHVWDPLAFCEGAWKILKPGGALAIIVHNRRALSAKLLGRKSPIFDIEHLQLFSRSSGERLLRSAGFTNVSVVSIWNRYPIYYWLKLFPFPRNIKLQLLALLRRSGVGNVPFSIAAGNLLLVGMRS